MKLETGREREKVEGGGVERVAHSKERIPFYEPFILKELSYGNKQQQHFECILFSYDKESKKWERERENKERVQLFRVSKEKLQNGKWKILQFLAREKDLNHDHTIPFRTF